jgi:prepilin-type processing-associated H-X9-DG protein
MKLNFSERKNRATTFFEALVVLACLLILAAVFLPALTHARVSQKLSCSSNLKQVNLAFRIWEGDNANQYPMSVSVTNGGAMELIEAGNVAGCFELASNEMSTTKIFVCPDDPNRTFATNFKDLNGSHISYFLSADVSSEENPQMVLDGDDNIAISGKPRPSGLVDISSNVLVSWFGTRHGGCGNIGFADGSVDEQSSNGLQQEFQDNGLATNRIAFP